MSRRMASALPVLLLPLSVLLSSSAAAAPPDPGDRTKTITVTYFEYAWWLSRWDDNTLACELVIDHGGLPTGPEIYRACGKTVHSEWLKTAPCPGASEEAGKSAECPGFYLHLAGQVERVRQVEIALPMPEVWIVLRNCEPPDFRCGPGTSLMLVGREYLPNEAIMAIRGTRDGLPFSCLGDTCPLPLVATPLDGVEVVFWGESTFGDKTAKFTARVRTLPAEPDPDSMVQFWQVDVLSSQWRGPSAGTCAEVWDALPPPGVLPQWLSTPARPEGLASSVGLERLASWLIAVGSVDAQDCPSGGLNADGSADACGLVRANPMVQFWQNRFDSQILDAARSTDIPAGLLKNLIGQESQFWPGAIGEAEEAGLGQISETGTDTILLWNRPFFDQFCPLVLDAAACSRGYARMTAANQATLRGALVLRLDSRCADCLYGVDLSHAGRSIELVAEAVLANCEQVGRMVYNTARKTPGRVSSYEDLWRFTLVNYNAGPGCLAGALKAAQRAREPLDWEHISGRLPAGCVGALRYVEQIAE